MRRSFVSLLLALTASTLPALAQTHFTLDQVLSAPFASAPAAAPVGSRIAWLLNEQGHRNIWLAEGPAWKARRVTNFNEDDGQDIADLAWTPDGRTLFFARGGDFENGGENPNPALSPARPDQSVWSVALDNAPARKLAEGHAPAVSPHGDVVAFLHAGQISLLKVAGGEPVEAVRERGVVSHLSWSPDGSQLAFTSTRHDHSFIGLYNPATNALHYLDPSTDFDSEPAWSPDGKRVAFLRLPSEPDRLRSPRREGSPWTIRVFDLTANKGQEIFRATPRPGSVFHPLASDAQLIWSGNRLVFPWEKDGWCHLYAVSPSSASTLLTPTLLTPGDGEVEHVAATAGGKKIYYSSNIGDIDRRHLWELDLTQIAPPKLLTRGAAIEWSPAPASDGSALLFLASSSTERAHAVVQLASGRTIALAPETVPSAYPAAALVAPQAVTVTASDGLELHAQLFLPQSSAGRHPALIFFHGGSRRQMLLGSHYMYYYSNAYAMNQFLANQGYVVLSVNYRSGIGYGLNFREALNYGLSGGSEYNDVVGAGLYLKARNDVDPARIGVWGGSYGGYLTAMALARASDLFAAGVDFHGVHDWSAFLNGKVDTGNPAREQAVHESLRIAYDSSPMASVDSWRSPVLLIHGDDDRNVAFSQTVMLADALRQRHVPYEERIFPNEIHDFLLHRSWLEAYQATADFFARHLRTPGLLTEPSTSLTRSDQ